MALRLRDLVGRVMVDPEFLADLQRSPEPILAQYDLTADERVTVRQALDRLARTPADRRAGALGDVLLRRVAT
jgi:hypothetical protein